MPLPLVPQQLCEFVRARGVVVLALAWGLAGCAYQAAPAVPEVPVAAAAETQRQRLAQTRLQLAALHFEEGRAAVAQGEIAQALQADPHNVDAYNLQGWVALSQQDTQAAGDSFAQALALRPDDAETLYNLAWLQCQQKQFEQAQTYFEQALAAPRKSGQSLVRIWLAKGVCLREMGQLAHAVAALEKAQALEPEHPVVAYNFADALLAQGQAERARFYVRRVNNGPWASAPSLWLGIQVERSLGDRIAVQQLADQLHKRFPDSKEWQRFEQGALDD